MRFYTRHFWLELNHWTERVNQGNFKNDRPHLFLKLMFFIQGARLELVCPATFLFPLWCFWWNFRLQNRPWGKNGTLADESTNKTTVSHMTHDLETKNGLPGIFWKMRCIPAYFQVQTVSFRGDNVWYGHLAATRWFCELSVMWVWFWDKKLTSDEWDIDFALHQVSSCDFLLMFLLFFLVYDDKR